MNYKDVDGEVMPSYAPDGNGNQPYYPSGANKDTEMPDFFHEGHNVIDITEARKAKNHEEIETAIEDAKKKHPGFSGGLPIDLTEIADTPLGSVSEIAKERRRHPSAGALVDQVVEAPVGEDENDPVIKEWMERRAAALARPVVRLTIAKKNENEADYIARTRQEFP